MSAVSQQAVRALRAWADRFGLPDRYVAVDTETSGLGPAARVLQLGWCLFADGGSVRSDAVAVDWYQRLGPDDAQKLTSDMAGTKRAMEARGNAYRWSESELRSRGVSPDRAADQFVAAWAGAPLCAHHGWGFDYPLIARFVEGALDTKFEPPHTDLLDTCLMARAALSGSTPRPAETYHAFVRRMSEVRCAKHTLAACVTTFDLRSLGASATHAHDAEYDAWLCGLLFERFRQIAAGGPVEQTTVPTIF